METSSVLASRTWRAGDSMSGVPILGACALRHRPANAWSQARRAAMLLVAALLVAATCGEAAADRHRSVLYRVGLGVGELEVLGDTRNHLELAVGAFDVVREGRGRTSAAFQLEARPGGKLWFVGPALGLMANTDGGVFGYGGLYADLAIGRVVFTPMLGLGGYRRGGSKDLGGVFQFRSALTVSYELAGGGRVGVRIAHISNAGIHSNNPGEEELLLTYTMPF